LRRRSAGGAGVARSDLGYFGCLQVESAADCRESLPTAAVIGAAAQVPSAAPPQRRPALLDLREPVVRQLAQFAPHCEAGHGVTAASTGLALLLVLAITAHIGRRPIPQSLQALIRHMTIENRLWGQKRI
jgi:hypothetical protein